MKNNGIFVVVLDPTDTCISWESVRSGLQHVLARVVMQIKLRENLAPGFGLGKSDICQEEMLPGINIRTINNATLKSACPACSTLQIQKNSH